jgi:hypothetical protein
LVLVAAFATGVNAAEWKIASEDGNSSIKFGFLMQGRVEFNDFVVPETDPVQTDTAQDFYLRRARLLIGGQIAPKWTFFIETDSPNLGKGESDGTKNAGDVYLQDWAVTFNQSDAFKLDMGMLLIPFGHNGTQSAASLLPVDYGVFSFLTNGPTDSRIGRDYGVLARGYLADKHFEYRAGVFSGQRGTDSTNDFRYVARVVYHVFEPEAGLFYSGTNLGKKKILSIGGSYDHQEEYNGYVVDVYWDQPIGEGNGLTLQADYTQLDGDTFLTALPKQKVIYAEAGFYFAGAKLMPYATYGNRNFDADTTPDVDVIGGGLAYYIAGHNRALKLQYTQTKPDGGTSLDTITLQMQVFQF